MLPLIWYVLDRNTTQRFQAAFRTNTPTYGDQQIALKLPVSTAICVIMSVVLAFYVGIAVVGATSAISARPAQARGGDHATETGSGSGLIRGTAHLWGRIANQKLAGQRVLGSIFFAGPPNPKNLSLYTRHPVDAALNGWTKLDATFALTQMTAIGLNTVFFSYWGHTGETDNWSLSLLFSKERWPGEAGSPQYSESQQVAKAHDLFALARQQGLLLAPLLEVSPSNPFWREFPDSTDNLVERCNWLLAHLGAETNWLQMYDRTGKPRYVVRLIETIHSRPIDPKQFAAGFSAAADRVLKETGYNVGFVIDPTPLPPYGAEFGPDPVALRSCPAILAIDPFNIDSQGLGAPRDQVRITEADRLEYAMSVLQKWHDSGIPLIAPILPGYDAHIVFPNAGVYGFNATWRQWQKALALHYATEGLSIDCWNGWAEGYAIPPSREDHDIEMLWATDVIKSLKAEWAK